MKPQPDYRQSHATPGYGAHYDRTITGGYYGAMYRAHEVPVLTAWARAVAPERCLDFACGTGRLTSVLVDVGAEVVGVDVSADMLDRARVAVPGATFHCVDLTVGGPTGDQECAGPFDLVTAFRFFQNAQPELRHQALRAIRSRMTVGAKLVLNVQSQAQSPAGRAYRLRSRLRSRPINTLDHAGVEALLQSHGFVVEQTHWYGHVPRVGDAAGRLVSGLDRPAERATARLHVPSQHVAQMFLVRARLDPERARSETAVRARP